MIMNRKAMLGLTAATPLLLRKNALAAEPLKIATLPVDASALAYYATDMGFFKERGLATDFHQLSGGAIPPAVVSGALDVGWSNMISLAAAYKRNIPFTVIAAGGVYVRGNPTSGLFVAKDSAVRSAADLNGKTIAVDALVNFGQFSTQAWIDKNGGDSSTVKWIEMQFGDMPGALAQKRVEAAFVGEPFIEGAKDTVRILGAPIDLIGPRVMIGAWFTTTGWAKANPEALKAFQQTMSETAAWANGHQSDSALILAKYSKVSTDTVRAMKRIAYGTKINAPEMQCVIDLAARYKAISATFPADDLIYH
jgi:NitT/TauT family transport system substrate-binding protein